MSLFKKRQTLKQKYDKLQQENIELTIYLEITMYALKKLINNEQDIELLLQKCKKEITHLHLMKMLEKL